MRFDIQRKRNKYNVLIKNSSDKISHSYTFVLEHVFNGVGCSFSVPFLFLSLEQWKRSINITDALGHLYYERKCMQEYL